MDFDGKVLTAEGVDIFVAKFDGDDGRCVWARRFGGAQDDRGRAVAVDRDRAIVVTGRFSGEADLGDSGPLVSSGQGDAFVAKYDPNGAHLWSRAFGGTQNDEGRDVAIDAAGSIFLTGSSGGDAFLAKYSSAGAPLFSQTFSGSSTQQGLSLAVDSGQNAVVTGWFSQRADFGGGQLDSAGDSEDVFLARYDDRGTHLWSERFGGIRHDRGQSVAVDGESVLVAGHFDHSATFGDKTVEGNAYDIFVLKLTPP